MACFIAERWLKGASPLSVADRSRTMDRTGITARIAGSQRGPLVSPEGLAEENSLSGLEAACRRGLDCRARIRQLAAESG